MLLPPVPLLRAAPIEQVWQVDLKLTDHLLNLQEDQETQVSYGSG
jgi:hypothetical protein